MLSAKRPTVSSIHIAIFKWKEGTSEEEVEEMLAVIRDLRTKVPGVRDIRCGKNYHRAAQGFTHGVVVFADDRAALQAYRNHPDHLRVAPTFEILELDGIGFDFDDPA
jgi:Stress responsive A/B Barrel Domain